MNHKAWYAPYVHPSEAIYAKLLDATSIKYQYETETLPVEWDDDGKAIRFFTPDFFLPDVHAMRENGTRYAGRYVEITTCRRSLVTYKHRKLKKAKRLYPEYEFLIVYRRDIYAICEELGFAYEMALLPDQMERYADELEELRELKNGTD